MASPPWMQEVITTRFDHDVFPFWDGLKEHRFLLHRCWLCGTFHWPMTLCRACDNATFDDMEWVPTSGRGTIFSYGIVHRATTPAWKSEVPYAAVLVELDEGPIFPTRLSGHAPDDLAIGMAVEVDYQDVPETGLTLPLFKPVGR